MMHDLKVPVQRIEQLLKSYSNAIEQVVNSTEKQNFAEFTRQEPDSPFKHSYKVGYLTSLKDDSVSGIYFVAHEAMPGFVGQPYTFFSDTQVLQGDESLIGNVLDAIHTIIHN